MLDFFGNFKYCDQRLLLFFVGGLQTHRDPSMINEHHSSAQRFQHVFRDLSATCLGHSSV